MSTVLPQTPDSSLKFRIVTALDPAIGFGLWFLERICSRTGSKVALVLALSMGPLYDFILPKDLSVPFRVLEVFVAVVALSVVILAVGSMQRRRTSGKFLGKVACAQLTLKDATITDITPTMYGDVSVNFNFESFGVELRDEDGRDLSVGRDILDLPTWRNWTVRVPADQAPAGAASSILPGTVVLQLDVSASESPFGGLHVSLGAADIITFDFPTYQATLTETHAIV
jgi:hypothetical protein